MIRIGPLQVDLARRELLLDRHPVRLGSRAFDMLVVLIEANGALVSKNEMLSRVWPDTIVEENNLQVHMSALRKVLGESRGLIQTVSGRGYRLTLTAAPAATSGEIESAPVTRADDELLAQELAQEFVRELAVTNNLPSLCSALIGRDEAIGDVTRALESARHVTLIGSGGIGKTRLATEVARGVLERFPDGVYLASLASTSDADSVLAMFASTIGVNPANGPLTLARVSRELRDRRVLVILDNCEHVLGPAAELAEALLNVSAGVSLLATSREPLRVPGETLYWVAALDVPGQDDAGQEVLQCSAVQLFLSRARSIDARFSTDERSVHLTGTVCRRLDGIPLAIELAAARAAILGIETLAAHLDDRFNMLNGGNRTALPRHQTLKATLDWSHALLDENERTTLRRLGIFVNGFTMDAAVAIAGDGVLHELDVIAAVSGLVEKSLVVARMEWGNASYRLLETTRAYAVQKLEDNGERRLVTLNHARYFLSLLDRDESGVDTVFAARTDERAHERTHELLDDLRAALGWALSSKGDTALGETLAVKVVCLLYELSLVDECCAWARRGFDAVSATHRASSHSNRHLHVRMQLLAALGAALLHISGPGKEARGIWADILASAIALGDQRFEARALWGLWSACQAAGATHNALGFARRFAALAAETRDAGSMVLGQRLLGVSSHYAGDQQCARASIEAMLQHGDDRRHRLPLDHAVDQAIAGRVTLARVLWVQGFRDRALSLAQDCVADACNQHRAIETCDALVEALIPLALLSGKRDCARDAIAVLQELSTRAGLSVWQACCRCFDEYFRSLDESTLERLHAFRAALDDLEALDFGAPRALLAAQYSVALGRAGRRDAGIATIDSELARCEATGEHWYSSELRRVRGELLLIDLAAREQPDVIVTDAQACLVAALEESSAQGAHSFQLRAATSLGRLWHAQDRNDEAAHILRSACSHVPEGHGLDDFQAAADLLRIVTHASAGVTASRGPDTALLEEPETWRVVQRG